MAVYVDQPIHQLGRMKMCHMVADSIEELHRMADRIGVARRHFQSPPKARLPHYDICKAKRSLAVKLGAIEVSSRRIVQVARYLRGG
jgi:hypothetical protein